MRQVSLIFPLTSARTLCPEQVERCKSSLESAGYDVAVLAVVDSTHEPIALEEQAGLAGVRWIRSESDGLAAAAITGLKEAEGDVRLVLDPSHGYRPEDLARTVEPIADERADLVIARWEIEADTGARMGPLRIASGWAGRLALRVLGASDPFAGLVAVSPGLVSQIAGTFAPVGSRFAMDLLVRGRGRRTEVAVRPDGARRTPPLGLDDFRHFKRLADDRLGNLSRLLQFCAVGASGMVLDLSCYAIFQRVFLRTPLALQPTPFVGGSLDLAAAGALSIAIALVWNFSLNRRLTFSYARGGSLLRQFVAYVMSNAVGVALSFWIRLFLPAKIGFFNQHKLAAAVVGIVAATGISFSLARWVVFRNRSGESLAPPDLAAVEVAPANSLVP